MASARRIGVCSWSLQAATPAELVERVLAVGVDCIQLALEPLREGRWKLAETQSALSRAGIEVRSGMMSTFGEDYSTLATIRATGGLRPTEHWEKNVEIARRDAELASRLGLKLVTFHAGFLPHVARDPERETMLGRLRAIVDIFAASNVRVAFETGQESAGTLVVVMRELDRPTAGVNFDPANMILYGMGEPVTALRLLGTRVSQVHIKDAKKAKKAGTWGSEVAVGSGEVDWNAFFGEFARQKLKVDMMIEREAGTTRVKDIVKARELVQSHVSAGAKQ
jgi:sugar phosphate isomerase/epimerase